jgi:putative transposase
MVKMVMRACKYRFYPTPGQAADLCRTFGCVRKVWNLVLAARTAAWHQRHEHLIYLQSSALLTQWKRSADLAFLAGVSSVPLQQALRHLQAAYTRFWAKQARYPRFKSRKKSRASAEYTRSGFRYRDGQLHLAKMTGPLAVTWSRPLPAGAEPSTVTVTRDAAGRWFVSLLCQCPVQPHPATDSVVGVDAGITSLVTDQRRDFLHKLTTRLVRDNQAVVIEDLSVRNMVRNHHLARAISDAAWRDMRGMLAYKCQWYGRDLVVVDRWYPSSKTCSGCGQMAASLPLGVREWDCVHCGTRHDRDINAAVNIRAAGLAVLACGAGVRPARELSRAGSRP